MVRLSREFVGALVLGLGCAGAASASWPSPAAAEPRADAPTARGDWRVHTGVTWWHEDVSPVAFDGDGDEYAYDGIGSARARLGGRFDLGSPRLVLDAEVDLYAQRVYGEPTRVGTAELDDVQIEAERFRALPVVPQALSLSWQTGLGLLKVGHQSSHWGLGLVAHGGRDDETALFGDDDRPSLVERVMFATAPLRMFGALPDSYGGRLTLVLAGDLVYADETAQLFDDSFGEVHDKAWQGVMSLVLRPRNWNTPPDRARHEVHGGVYVVRRAQTYDEGDTLDVWVLDAFAKYQQQWNRTNTISYAIEMAWITGETDRLVTEHGRDGLDVEAFGAAFEMGWAWQLGPVPMRLGGMAGIASGDGDPDDDRLQRFTFHGDYDVGVVLFDHVVPAMQRRAMERISNPVRSKDPPKGAEAFVTRGNLSGVSYGALRLSIGPWYGVDGGVQFASTTASAPFVDPFVSFAHGGEPTNPYGGNAEGSLGNELDFVLRYTFATPRGSGLEPSLRVIYGAFFPGEALEGPHGALDTVHLVQVRLGVDFALEGS